MSVPPYHIAGVANLLSNLYVGRRIVYLDALRPRSSGSTPCAATTITHAMVVPTMLARLVDSLDERTDAADADAALACRTAARAMPATVLAARHRRCSPTTDLVNAYGLTETSSTIAVLGPDDHRAASRSDDPAGARAARRRPAGCCPASRCEIRDDDDGRADAGEVGDIWVRGEQVSGEYDRRAARRRRRRLVPHSRPRLARRRRLPLHRGPRDDTIIRGGENIAPAEIEEVLLRHPDVEPMRASSGIPDDEWGQRIAAVVVLREGAPLDVDALTSFARDELRGSKTPDVMSFATELPVHRNRQAPAPSGIGRSRCRPSRKRRNWLMATALDGIKVLEVASWTFVPAAGAVLADWGADVIKVEHPVTGDPQRGLIAMGLIPGGDSAVNYIIEQPNRGKRSIGLDITTDARPSSCSTELARRATCSSRASCPKSASGSRSTSSTSGRSTRASSTHAAPARARKGPDAGKGGYDGAVVLGARRRRRGPDARVLRVPDRRPRRLRRPGRRHGHRRRDRRGPVQARAHRRGARGRRVAARRSPCGQLSPDIVASRLYGGDPMPKFDHLSSPEPARRRVQDQGRPLRHA